MFKAPTFKATTMLRQTLTVLSLATLLVTAQAAEHKRPKPPKSLRLYIFDCGTIHTKNTDGYSLKPGEAGNTEMSIPCIMVVHPKGALMWDNGDIPDSAFPAGGGPAKAGVVTQDKQLLPQLAAVGYTPADIKYFAISHDHGDHVANANAFAGSIWLTRKAEYDRMFATEPVVRSPRENYIALKDSKKVFLDKDEYDVFGDGTVILKSTPGHTVGHQVMFLKLKKTGPIVLSGDLYHYPEERTLNRLPVADFNRDQTAASRADLEVFLKKTGAQLWIQHDITHYKTLKIAPDYYE